MEDNNETIEFLKASIKLEEELLQLKKDYLETLIKESINNISSMPKEYPNFLGTPEGIKIENRPNISPVENIMVNYIDYLESNEETSLDMLLKLAESNDIRIHLCTQIESLNDLGNIKNPNAGDTYLVEKINSKYCYTDNILNYLYAYFGNGSWINLLNYIKIKMKENNVKFEMNLTTEQLDSIKNEIRKIINTTTIFHFENDKG